MSVLIAAPPADRFAARLGAVGTGLRRAPLEILQVNVGRRCNQTCRHCHVNAGPTRTEQMSPEVADLCIRWLDAAPSIHTLDVTGGAPELAQPFRDLVRAGRARGKRVIDRCNLTILSEPGQEDLAEFLAAQRVDVVASLPCYTAENVDKQRGDGVFERSLVGLRMLNALGYGAAEGQNAPDALRLNLVYNPLGPKLPGKQDKLEAAYRERLLADWGVVFDHLITITNMPIGRFRSDLLRSSELDGYLGLLETNFNPAAVEGLMCRNTLSVDYEGYLFDCDFNQMLGLPLAGRKRLHLRDVTPATLAQLPIATGDHCLGCTAGSGSSCGGALVKG